MGQTIIEKIIARHTEDAVHSGATVWMDLDVRTARDFGGPNVVKHLLRVYGEDVLVDDPAKTFFTFDTNAPANTIGYAENQQVCRDFARPRGIRVYDVDRGIGSHVMMEEGYVIPGTTLVGTDSHLNILGAVGAFGQGMGDRDIAFGFKTGRTWFEVPETIRIRVEGEFTHPTTPKDLTLAVVKKMGASGCLGKAVEFYGKAIDQLNLAGRITLCSMGTETGAVLFFVPPNNEEVLAFCAARSGCQVDPILADEDAVYAAEIVLDVQDLKPQVAVPFRPDRVSDVETCRRVKIGSGFIGSCTNGRFEDMEAAAGVLRGRRVAESAVLKVVPATREVYGRMLQEGLLDVFYESGALVSNPGCAGCASGQIGMTGKGEVQISTSNRNFAGKQGSGETYLASPVTVAASAVLGRIGTVDEL